MRPPIKERGNKVIKLVKERGNKVIKLVIIVIAMIVFLAFTVSYWFEKIFGSVSWTEETKSDESWTEVSKSDEDWDELDKDNTTH
jgi:hypothetical protein